MLKDIVFNFFIAYEVVFGASLFSGFSAILTNKPPLKSMLSLAESVKVWAIAIALGGTFDSFEIIEKGLFKGEIKTIIRQVICILFAMLGANVGWSIIKLIQKCGEIWGKS